jgi:hypothetical protein
MLWNVVTEEESLKSGDCASYTLLVIAQGCPPTNGAVICPITAAPSRRDRRLVHRIVRKQFPARRWQALSVFHHRWDVSEQHHPVGLLMQLTQYAHVIA